MALSFDGFNDYLNIESDEPLFPSQVCFSLPIAKSLGTIRLNFALFR
jgi:hypothetical protein